MRKKLKRRKTIRAKWRLGLPDLEHAKSAVLVSLRSPESQRSYRRSIEDFVCWYCSEPRLSIQQNRGDALQDSSGREAAGSRHYQREACRSSTTRLRGGRYRIAQSRFGCWYSSSERGKETWHETWQLADGGGSTFLVATAQHT